MDQFLIKERVPKYKYKCSEEQRVYTGPLKAERPILSLHHLVHLHISQIEQSQFIHLHLLHLHLLCTYTFPDRTIIVYKFTFTQDKTIDILCNSCAIAHFPDRLFTVYTFTFTQDKTGDKQCNCCALTHFPDRIFIVLSGKIVTFHIVH